MSQLAAVDIVAAAIHLMHAGQWAAAARLLTAAQADDPAERAALALALAEVAVDQDFGQQTDAAPAALATADAAAAAAHAAQAADAADAADAAHDAGVDNAADADRDGSWDLALLKLRKDYSTALFRGDGGRHGQAVSGDRDLRERALALIEEAPDDARRGTASFWAGVIADNLHEQSAEAIAHYTTALDVGEKTDDERLMSLALRHLGHHAHMAGDLALARMQWERSTELLQRVGHIRATLAQQNLLAVLRRDEGDAAGSRALATETNRWARQLGVLYIAQDAAGLMA